MVKFYIFIIFIGVILPSSADTFVGHVRHRPPWVIVESGNFSGPVLKIIEISLARQGHKITWLDIPWVRTLNMAKNGGHVDILPRHSMTSERYDYLLPILYGYRKRKLYYFSRKESDIQINKFEDLQKYMVGQIRGSFYSHKYNNSNFSKRIEVNVLEQLVAMLTHGRIDIVVISEAQGHISHFKNNPNFRQLDYKEIFFNGRYFSIPKHSPMAKFYDDINDEINKMRENNEINKIFSQYSLEEPIQAYTDEDIKNRKLLNKM